MHADVYLQNPDWIPDQLLNLLTLPGLLVRLCRVLSGGLVSLELASWDLCLEHLVELGVRPVLILDTGQLMNSTGWIEWLTSGNRK
jgi:hypothetical protein